MSTTTTRLGALKYIHISLALIDLIRNHLVSVSSPNDEIRRVLCSVQEKVTAPCKSLIGPWRPGRDVSQGNGEYHDEIEWCSCNPLHHGDAGWVPYGLFTFGIHSGVAQLEALVRVDSTLISAKAHGPRVSDAGSYTQLGKARFRA